MTNNVWLPIAALSWVMIVVMFSVFAVWRASLIDRLNDLNASLKREEKHCKDANSRWVTADQERRNIAAERDALRRHLDLIRSAVSNDEEDCEDDE